MSSYEPSNPLLKALVSLFIGDIPVPDSSEAMLKLRAKLKVTKYVGMITDELINIFVSMELMRDRLRHFAKRGFKSHYHSSEKLNNKIAPIQIIDIIIDELYESNEARMYLNSFLREKALFIAIFDKPSLSRIDAICDLFAQLGNYTKEYDMLQMDINDKSCTCEDFRVSGDCYCDDESDFRNLVRHAPPRVKTVYRSLNGVGFDEVDK